MGTVSSASVSVEGDVTGSLNNDMLGFNITNAGDLNNDGWNDIAIGAPYFNTNQGAVYVFYGGDWDMTTLNQGNANRTISGSSGDYFGWSVSTAGDVDGDGNDELLIGAPGSDDGGTDSGAAYIYDLDSGVSYKTKYIGGEAGDAFGTSMCALGDIDEDGWDDFAVGAPKNNTRDGQSADQGAVHIFHGNDSLLTVNYAEDANMTLNWGSSGDWFGQSIANAGDVDGDGNVDLYVGAPMTDVDGTSDAGAVYLYTDIFRPFGQVYFNDFESDKPHWGIMAGTDWGYSSTQYHSGTWSMGISYGNDALDVAAPVYKVDLQNATHANFGFWHRYMTDSSGPEWDSLRVEFSQYPYDFWKVLESYDSTSLTAWAEVEYDVSEFCGDWVWFRMWVESDSSLTGNWYVDDVYISCYDDMEVPPLDAVLGTIEDGQLGWSVDGLNGLDQLLVGEPGSDEVQHGQQSAGEVIEDSPVDFQGGTTHNLVIDDYDRLELSHTDRMWYNFPHGFENTTGGDPPGWTVTEPGGTDVSIVTTEFTEGSKSLRMRDTSNPNDCSIYHDFHPISSGVVEFDWMTDTEDFFHFETLLYTNWGYVSEIYFDNNSDPDMGYWDGVNDMYFAPYVKDTWYHMRIEFNCSLGVFDIYVDGELMADDAPFMGAASTLNRISFNTTGNGPSCYLDDVRVYSIDHATLGYYGSAVTTTAENIYGVMFDADIIESGQVVEIRVTRDGGTNWASVDPLVPYLFTNGEPAGNQLAYNLTFRGNKYYSPLVGDVVIRYGMVDELASFTGPSGSRFGHSVNYSLDLDTNGHIEAAIGAPYSTNGDVYLFDLYPSLSGTVAHTSANQTYTGENSGDQFGLCVASVPDLKTDGSERLLVGAPLLDGGGTDRGKAYIYAPAAVDHFDVTASTGTFAGNSFTVTVTAKDSGDVTIGDWAGTVDLQAMETDGTTPTGDALGTTQITLASGTGTLNTEKYYVAETIRIRAHLGAAEGLSSNVVITPGVLNEILLDRSTATFQAGGSNFDLNVSTTGVDQWYNTNTTWAMDWETNGSGASVTSAGLFTPGTVAGSFYVWCNSTREGVTNYTSVTVFPAPLNSISLGYSSVTRTVGSGTFDLSTGMNGWDQYSNINNSWTQKWELNAREGSTVSNAGVLTPGDIVETFRVWLNNTADTISDYIDVTLVPDGLDEILMDYDLIVRTAGDPAVDINATTHGIDQYGNTNNSFAWQWSSNATGTGSVDSTGTLTPGTKAEVYWATLKDGGSTVQNHTVVWIKPDALNDIALEFSSITASVNGSDLDLNRSTVGYDQYWNVNSSWSHVWETNSTTGCTVDQDGILSLSTTTETFWVWCNSSVGGISNHTVITLKPGALDEIIMDHTEINATAGGPSLDLNVTTHGLDGFDNVNNTWPWKWETNAAGGATVTQAGVFTPGTVAGTFWVWCNSTQAPISNYTIVHVLPAQLHRIEMTYSEINMVAGGPDMDLNTSTHGYDIYGNLNDTWDWNWNDNSATSSIDSAGLFTPGTIPGTVYVYCNNTDNSVSNLTIIYILPEDLHHIKVLPREDMNITTDDQINFTCMGYDKYDNLRGPLAVNWSMTNFIGTLTPGPSAASTFIPDKVGITYVNVTYGPFWGISGKINVSAGALAYITIDPHGPLSVTTDETLNFTAFGWDAKGNNRGPEIVNWSLVGSIGEVLSTTGGTTQLRLTSAGKGRMEARIGSLYNITEEISVAFGDLKELRIVPGDIVEMTTDDEQMFVVNGYDKWGNLLGAVNATWWVTGGIGLTDPGPASSSFFDPTTVGIGAVWVRNGSVINSTANFTVRAGELHNLTLTPSSVQLKVSEYQDFVVTPADADGNYVKIDDSDWSTDVGFFEASNATWARFQAQDLVEFGGFVKVSVGDISTSAVVDVLPVGGRPIIQGYILDILKFEDAPSWTMDMKNYQPKGLGPETELFWYLTGVNESLVTIGGEMSTAGVLTFVPVPDAFGSNKVTFWLSSKEGLTDSQVVWINITPVNDPPTISQPPDLLIRYDQPYSFDYTSYVSDIDDPISGLSLSAAETGGSGHVTTSGLSATFAFTEDYLGDKVIVTLTVSDGKDNAKKAISLEVTDDFTPEVITPLPDVTIYEGERLEDVFKLNEHFMDPDMELIYFSSRTQHLTITIKADTSVDIAALSLWTGDELVSFRAQDERGALVEDTIIVHILPKNNAPEIGDVPDLMVHYDAPYTFDLKPYISDADTPLSQLSLVLTNPYVNISERDHLSIVLIYPKALVRDEPYKLLITISDGELTASTTINVVVSDNWPPERTNFIPDITLLEDQEALSIINLKDYFSDRDNDEVYYSYGNIAIDVKINNNGTVDFILDENWFGIEYLTFRATDSKGALIEDTIKITVLPVNDPPILAGLPDQEGDAGKMWRLDLLPYLSDIDDNVSTLDVWVEVEDSSGMDIVIAGSELIFFGSQEYSGPVKVFVSDGESTSEQTFNVTMHASVTTTPNDNTSMYLLFILLAVIVVSLLILLLVFKQVYLGSYRIEEAFIVDKHGMCLAHRSARQERDMDTDSDIFTGMLTVIQQFVKDSFKQKQGKDEYLDMFTFGETTVLIEQGQLTFIAIFFKGSPGKRLRGRVEKFLKKLEKEHAVDIRGWQGDTKKLQAMGDKLEELVGKNSYSPSTVTEPEIYQGEVISPQEPFDPMASTDPLPSISEDTDMIEDDLDPSLDEVDPIIELEGEPLPKLPESSVVDAVEEQEELDEESGELLPLPELDALPEDPPPPED